MTFYVVQSKSDCVQENRLLFPLNHHEFEPNFGKVSQAFRVCYVKRQQIDFKGRVFGWDVMVLI